MGTRTVKVALCDRMSDEQILRNIYNAARQYSLIEGKRYLIVGKMKGQDEYIWFQCKFPAINFMHLLAIASPNYSAKDFYKAALNIGELKIADCKAHPTHYKNDVKEKCYYLQPYLDLNKIKSCGVGKKDLINQKVDFNFSYGKECTLGFKYEKGNSNITFPVSFYPSNIHTFSSKVYGIPFILEYEKGLGYSKLFKEIAPDMYSKLMNSETIPIDLKELCKAPYTKINSITTNI